MDLDKILCEIGEFGNYQKKLILLVFLPCMFPCAFHAYNQLFMAISPPHCCISKNLHDERGNFSYHNDDTCIDGYKPMNLGDFNLNIMTKEFLICESDLRLTIGLVLFGTAGFIGSYLFGYLQDRIGRQAAFFSYLVIESFFGIGTAFAGSYWSWLIFRCGVGFTVPAILSTPHVLPFELVGPKYRTRCTIYSNIAYSLALVALAAVVYVFRNWRFLSLATSFPFLFFFIYFWYMPESPRWLLATGRYQRAIVVLKKIAKHNGTELKDEHLSQLKKGFEGEKQDYLLKKSKQYGVRDLFIRKTLRKKTLIITFIWFTNTSVYVGLSYYAPALSGDRFFNFFLAGISELPTYIVLWPTMERYGRREILCSSMLIGGIACLMTSIASGSQDTVRLLYCIGKMGISSSYVVLPLFASELFPTVVRGIGLSVGSVAGMLGPIFIPLVNYWGIGSCLPLILMGVLLVFGGLFSLLLPETKNIHLPETISEDGQ
ncbi:beta-alanine transporter [Planococcus citri]|uniref:beta-alanine transporter n=1 Tax=Planococcus citri TaxID=170843 RepID=UPI0031F91C98